MTKVSDFDTASVQATLFTPGLSFVPSKILAGFLAKWSNSFDGPPISIPAPPEMPPEIPRIMLESADKKHKAEFAPARINLFRFRKENSDRIDVPEFLDYAAAILSDYVEIVGGTVGRIAVVQNRFLKESNPGRFLSQHFCKKKWLIAPFDRPESFEIHAHKQYLFAGQFRINSWVRCKTGWLGKKPNALPIVLVEQDINTLSEEAETREFSDAEIKEFFQNAGTEFDSVLSLYFPLED